MLVNRTCRTRKLVAASRRHSQLSPTYPFSKLRAFPFKLTPDDAILQMAPHAALLVAPNAPFSFHYKSIIGSLINRYLPGLGFESFRPIRMTPVYFPGWIIDAEVSAEFSYAGVERTASGIIHDSYLPGSDYQVLSWTSYFSKEVDVDPVPFTKDLEVQHDMEVSCLPYTITPFAALDLAKSMSSRDTSIDEDGLRFDPKSLKTNLLAAYPVLFPLYLAQYRSPVPEGQQLVTVFIEAFGQNGRIRAQRRDMGKELRDMMPGAPQMFIDFTHELDNIDIATLRGDASPFFNVAGFLTPERRAIGQSAAEWLNQLIIRHEAGPALVEKSGIITSDHDPRIRPFSSEERMRNMEWMVLSGEIESMKRVVMSMKETHEKGRIIHVSSKKAIPQDIFDVTITSLQSRIEEIETKRKENTPPWWKEWLEISSKEKSN